MMEHLDTTAAYAPCVNEFGTLLTIANFTLWLGMVAAIAISIPTVIERLMAAIRRPAAGEAGGGGPAAGFLDSLKGLITALAAAPPSFAIFLAGALLLWCAGKFTPAGCHQQFKTDAPTDSEVEKKL